MMSRKSNTIYEITAKFIVKALPSIEGDPTYDGIKNIMQLLYANAVTLPAPQGRGYHGYISSIIKPTLYTTLVAAAWTNPPNLGV